MTIVTGAGAWETTRQRQRQIYLRHYGKGGREGVSRQNDGERGEEGGNKDQVAWNLYRKLQNA